VQGLAEVVCERAAEEEGRGDNKEGG